MKIKQWTSRDEEAYREERKNRCDHCHPDHDETLKWLDNVANMELIYAVYSQYGINPDTIYKEFEAEITVHEERIIPEPIVDVA